MHHVLIGEVIPAAPAVPAVLTSLAGLFTILLWGVALALLLVWRRSFGALLLGLADEMDKVSVRTPFGRVHPLGVLSAWLRAVNYLIENGLSVSATGAEHAATFCFRWAGWFWHATALSIRFLAHDTAKALYGLTHHTIPRIVNATAAVLEHELHALPGQIDQRTHAIIRPFEHGLSRVEALAHRTAIALPREIAGVRGRIGRAERTLERDASRLTRLEKALGVAALTATVVTILGRLGLRWLRCGNVNRVGRSVCGMNASLLESLLADALLVGGALSLVDLAEHMQGVVGESAGLIQQFWDAA